MCCRFPAFFRRRGMEVVSIFPRRNLTLETTKCWESMGLNLEVQMSNCSYHTNIIISVIDSGIYYKPASFSPDKVGDFSRDFLGINDPKFKCNIEVLMLILAGNLVKNASFGKLKIGTTRGGVPVVKIVVYKLVLGSLCYGFMTRAFTVGIEDKVDILNLSIGHPNDDEKIKMREFNYFDETELGTYRAMLHDVLSYTAAGNDSARTKNLAPWALCVAACNSLKTFTTKILVSHSNFLKKVKHKAATHNVHGAMFLVLALSFPAAVYDNTSCNIALVEKSTPKAGPKRTTERAWPMHLPRPKEGKGISNSRPKVEPKSTTERGMSVSSILAAIPRPKVEPKRTTEKVDERIRWTLRVTKHFTNQKKSIYQVYFDASGGDKVALPDHKKFLEDVFGR
ncbi:unnamed protein product [Camellia sinensis]